MAGLRRIPSGSSSDGPRARYLVLVAVAILLHVGATARAAEWDLEPRIRLAETFTNNVNLASENEEWDLITEVTPGVRLSGEGRRAQVELDYQAQSLFYLNEFDRNDVNHRLGANGSVELVRERLFMEGDLTRREDLLEDDELIPDPNIFGERESVTTYGAGPRFQYGFGSFARLQSRYRRSGVHRSDSGLDSTTDFASVGLTSGPAFVDWGWAANYERTQENLDVGSDVDDERIFERASGELNYRIGVRTQLFAVGGVEDNEFETSGEDEIDGSFWEAGFRWSPVRRMTLEAAAGERFFGETKRFSLNAQGRALSLDVTYQEELVTSTSLEQERAVDPPVIGEDDPLPPPTRSLEVILEERLSGTLAWERGYSRISMGLIATEREFLESGDMEQTERIELGYRWSRLRRTVVNLGLDWVEQEVAPGSREDRLFTARLGATRDMGDGVSASADLRFDERDSTDDGREFEAIRATVALERRF